MASHSLLDLVCQLQNFETKISEIVMEMATKLCALNDTKLFVLLSTSMGRKVVGAPELCNQFFRQQLHADGTEVYLEYDHSRNAMMEVPILPFDRNMPVFPGSPFVAGTGSRKRTSADNGTEDRSKSPRLETHNDGGSGTGGGGGGAGSSVGGIESQFEAWDTEDAECLVIEEKPDSAVALPSTFSPPNAKPSNGAHHSIIPWRNPGTMVVRTITPARSSSKGANPDYELSDGARSQLTEFFVENQYAHAFVDCDALNVTNRDSKEHKVLASLIMQFAKHCGPFCPADKPDRVAFINHSFDIMWQHLPNLHSYENHVINNGHQNYSMRGYCKTRFSGRMNSISARSTRR